MSNLERERNAEPGTKNPTRNPEPGTPEPRASAIVISESDNVATALEAIDAGTLIQVRGGEVHVREPIPRGHKVAIRAIAAGDAVLKYGSSIGIATAEIPAGAHVHTHNVASARGRGDLR